MTTVKKVLKEIKDLQERYGFTPEEAAESVIEDLIRAMESLDKK